MKTRTAILLDENGAEIWRGLPSEMKIIFRKKGEYSTQASMADVAESGIPIDVEDGNDLDIAEEN